MKELTKKCRAKLGNHYGPMVTSTIALFAVWLFNGLWHGAGWSFIFFGMYHFALIVTGNLLQPAVIGFCEKHGIDRQKPWYRGFQIVRTFLLVSIGEMFFRALSLKHGLSMFARMISRPSIAGFLDGTMFQVEMDPQDYVIVVVTVLFVFVISLLQEKGYKVRDHLMAKNLFVRSMVTVGLAAFLILFGAYGAGYVPVDPIYANF
jgi:D-alanyl-lipoteichoic acid acyltransferase DltB (MBOAT superfamily)